MKIVSLNIGGNNDFASRLESITGYLSRSSPDVTCLQEVMLQEDASPYSQARQINNVLNFPHITELITRYYVTSKGDAYKEGLAIISKHPLSNVEGFTHVKMPDDKHQRIALLAEVETDSGTIRLANAHFSNNEYSRMQLSELTDLLSARHEQRIIIGDFNMSPEDVSQLAGDGYQSSRDFKEYVSYPSKSETLDYALVPNGFSYKSVSADDTQLSDHAPLTVEISS
ncbi:MAG TPA: endonuclease/exonuclease/phosphatase family protein [Candidatus Saccharimonadales bacterium]